MPNSLGFGFKLPAQLRGAPTARCEGTRSRLGAQAVTCAIVSCGHRPYRPFSCCCTRVATGPRVRAARRREGGRGRRGQMRRLVFPLGTAVSSPAIQCQDGQRYSSMFPPDPLVPVRLSSLKPRRSEPLPRGSTFGGTLQSTT